MVKISEYKVVSLLWTVSSWRMSSGNFKWIYRNQTKSTTLCYSFLFCWCYCHCFELKKRPIGNDKSNHIHIHRITYTNIPGNALLCSALLDRFLSINLKMFLSVALVFFHLCWININVLSKMMRLLFLWFVHEHFNGFNVPYSFYACFLTNIDIHIYKNTFCLFFLCFVFVR